MIPYLRDRERMWLLVTGTGRCGTGYVAQSLISCGVKCTHEKVFNLQGIEWAKEQIRLRAENPHWGWQADASWLAMPYLDDPCMDDLEIVHLVRHPRNVVRSLGRINNWTSTQYSRGQAFLYGQIPDLLDWHDMNARSAYFWLKWNEAIEPHADILHRVEDPVQALLDMLRIDWTRYKVYDNTHYNTREFAHEDDFELEDLPKDLLDAVVAKMDQYGYEVGGHGPTYYERRKGLGR